MTTARTRTMTARKKSKKNRGGEEKFKLTKEKTKPSKLLEDYSILLYGEKKIGKTQLASVFPKCLQIMTEPGGKAIASFQEPCPDWKRFRKIAAALTTDSFYRNVSIDTADLAYQQCIAFTCDRLGIEHPSDEDWGKGWQAVRDEFTTQINKILHSGKGAIFISHAVEREVKTRTGKKFNRMVTTLTGAGAGVLEGIVDIWGCLIYEGGQRRFVIEGDDFISAGHRCRGHFLYTDGTPIPWIPMGSSPEEAYENFSKAFSNELDNPEAPTKRGVRARGRKGKKTSRKTLRKKG